MCFRMVEERTTELFDKIKKHIPRGSKISDIKFEGCEIVLYTKSKDFFLNNSDLIKSLVNEFKKRIKVRPDPSICLDMSDAEKILKKIIPKEAGLQNISFEPAFGRVIIEADKPGLVIGKKGELLQEIKRKTLWSPLIKRSPAIPSDIIKVLREILYKESEWRKNFLDKVGRAIHSGWKETKWVRATFLGGAREVGRSCILLQTPESKVLLDCGIKPSTNEFPYLDVPEFDINSLNAIIISHSHMDHCAAVPILYKIGCKVPLYCTTPTRDLMVLLWMDYMKLAQKEGRDPPFETKDIKQAIKHTICLDYNEVSDITPDIRLTLINSGHILGGSICHLHIGNGLHNVLYTGDIKFDRTALFDPASLNFTRAETVICESTYGHKEDIQPRRDESEKQLFEIAKSTYERGGICLFPSFAVERSQDVMVILEKMGFKGNVYLDGMVWDATAIHTAYPEYFNKNLRNRILQQDDNPFINPMFKRIGSLKEREKIIQSKEPCVVIATSGMLVGGPSVWWLQQIAEDPNSTLCFIGYQAEGSLGRRIQKGWKEVPMQINGKTVSVPIKCQIKTIEGLSGHSDVKQLINYLKRLKQRPERVITVHGEAAKCIDFARNVHKTIRCETYAPRLLETLRFK